MGNALQTVVTSDRVAAAIFVLLALGLVVFALYLVGQAIVFADELRPLRVVLAALSLAFGGALIYEAGALWTRRYDTISQILAGIFRTHQVGWVVVFGVLMFCAGLLTLHFTRVAQPASPLVQVQRALSARAHPVVWGIALGAAIAVASLLVSYFDRFVLKRPQQDPGYSWWVVYLGGALYGIGALVTWLFDWKP